MEYTNSSIFGNNGGVERGGSYEGKYEIFSDNNMERGMEDRERKEESSPFGGESSIDYDKQPELGEIVSEQKAVTEKIVQDEGQELILGTDMPKMVDRDGIEKEYVRKIDVIKKEKDFSKIGRAYRELRKKLLYERYNRVIGESK